MVNAAIVSGSERQRRALEVAGAVRAPLGSVTVQLWRKAGCDDENLRSGLGETGRFARGHAPATHHNGFASLEVEKNRVISTHTSRSGSADSYATMKNQNWRSMQRSMQPSVVIVGRPNVGKSTLFNRITGARRAIVGNEPGITRDRIRLPAEWRGRKFDLIDTGGILVGDQAEIPAQILKQARVAIDEAWQIIFVIDGRTEITGPDRELARLLRHTGRPVTLAVNKVDAVSVEAGLGDFYSLGIERVVPISAEHKKGVDELLELITADFPVSEPASGDADSGLPDSAQRSGETTSGDSASEVAPDSGRAASAAERRPIQVAIIGKPNAGKSTLLNRLAGEQRAIVSPIPGTTRDAVDALVKRGSVEYNFVDTAGIRRKGKTRLMAEKLSVVMARRHIRLADVVLLLIDGEEGVTALDATIAGYANESGKAVVLVVNKWDVARTKLNRDEFSDKLRNELKFLDYAPVEFISALTGSRVERLFELIQRAYRAAHRRIPTAELNRFFSSLDLERATVPAGQRFKVLYLTQASVAPPTFVLFTDRARKLHFGFERFLINQFRKGFDFAGTPVVIRARSRSDRR